MIASVRGGAPLKRSMTHTQKPHPAGTGAALAKQAPSPSHKKEGACLQAFTAATSNADAALAEVAALAATLNKRQRQGVSPPAAPGVASRQLQQQEAVDDGWFGQQGCGCAGEAAVHQPASLESIMGNSRGTPSAIPAFWQCCCWVLALSCRQTPLS